MKITIFIHNSQGIGEKDMKNKRFERGYCIVFFNELIHFSLYCLLNYGYVMDFLFCF